MQVRDLHSGRGGFENGFVSQSSWARRPTTNGEVWGRPEWGTNKRMDSGRKGFGRRCVRDAVIRGRSLLLIIRSIFSITMERGDSREQG